MHDQIWRDLGLTIDRRSSRRWILSTALIHVPAARQESQPRLQTAARML